MIAKFAIKQKGGLGSVIDNPTVVMISTFVDVLLSVDNEFIRFKHTLDRRVEPERLVIEFERCI